MNIDIENINTIENRNKVCTQTWRTISKVIQPDFLQENDFFPDDFIKKCEYNANEAQFLPLEVKNNINRMATEQGLYKQVVVLCQKDLKLTE